VILIWQYLQSVYTTHFTLIISPGQGIHRFNPFNLLWKALGAFPEGEQTLYSLRLTSKVQGSRIESLLRALPGIAKSQDIMARWLLPGIRAIAGYVQDK
jgi:hypothetical protein